MTRTRHRALLLAAGVLAVLGPAGAAGGSEADDVRAAAQRLWDALNRRDLDAWSLVVDDQAVGFNLVSPFPVEGKPAMRQVFEGLFSSTQSFRITPLDFRYRVLGETGVAWGYVVVVWKPRDGPLRTVWGRETLGFAKVAGSWRLVSVHASSLPAGGL